MCKRYFGTYKSDEMVCQSYIHHMGNGSSMKTMKGYIKWYRDNKAQYNPRDFRIYDTWADCPPDEHVPCVYQES